MYLKKCKTITMMILVALLVMAGCSTSEEAPMATVEVPPVPTQTVIPTKAEPQPPTKTPIPEPTATPEFDPSKIKFGVGAYELQNLDGGGPVLSTAFAPTNNLLATAGFGHITAWNMKSLVREQTLEGHTDIVLDLEWTPDGSLLASASWDGTVILWDMATYEQAALLETGPASSLDFSPDGSLLVVGTTEEGVQIWKIADRDLTTSIKSPTNATVNSVDWSPDGTMIASGELSGQVYLWDVETGDLLDTLEDPGGELSSTNSVAWSSSGELLASGHENGKVYLWDTTSWEPIRIIDAHKGRVSSVAWMPNRNVLASGGDDNTATLWDVKTGIRASGAGADSTIFSLDWSSDGKFLAVGSAGRLTGPSWFGSTTNENYTVNFNEGAGNCLLYIRVDNQ